MDSSQSCEKSFTPNEEDMKVVLNYVNKKNKNEKLMSPKK